MKGEYTALNHQTLKSDTFGVGDLVKFVKGSFPARIAIWNEEGVWIGEINYGDVVIYLGLSPNGFRVLTKFGQGRVTQLKHGFQHA